MVLLIGESVGWQELILIGILALIIFGPRKLPEMGRKIGKYMAEFRRATAEFKATWESEVSTISKDFKDELKDTNDDMRMLAYLETPKPVENSIGRNTADIDAAGVAEENGNLTNGNKIESPVIRRVDPPESESDAAQLNPAEETMPAEPVKESKKDWL